MAPYEVFVERREVVPRVDVPGLRRLFGSKEVKNVEFTGEEIKQRQRNVAVKNPEGEVMAKASVNSEDELLIRPLGGFVVHGPCFSVSAEVGVKTRGDLVMKGDVTVERLKGTGSKVHLIRRR